MNLDKAKNVVENWGWPEVDLVTDDSRLVREGSLYFCLETNQEKARAYIEQAWGSGAKAIVAAAQTGDKELICPEPREDFKDFVAYLSAAAFGWPSRSLCVIGVTGTNGKTTTAWLLKDILGALGHRSAYIGTLGFGIGDAIVEGENTTPVAPRLQKMLAKARAGGANTVAMEVSSHALADKRADYVEFDAAIFTHLSQDHLDFHGSMEAYEQAKFRLFDALPKQSKKAFTAVLPIEDEVGSRWAQALECNKLTYGESTGDVEIERQRVSVEEVTVRVRFEGSEVEATANVGGEFNFRNVSSAVAGALAVGARLTEIPSALAKTKPVPGRFETVSSGNGVSVVVDYAHTPDAVEKLLQAVRASGAGLVTTVFGCGGDRDRGKRPKMVRAAKELSTRVILTSDNPRTENPEQIFEDMRSGIEGAKNVEIIQDRATAIRAAIREAEPGTVVVIAGKGHENYQIIGKEKLPFDDKKIAAEALGVTIG